MKAEDKVKARALIRAVMNIADQDAEAADMSAAFDAGEWSARFHGPGSQHVGKSIRVLLTQLNMTVQEAHDVLMSFAQLAISDTNLTPAGYETWCWIAAEFEDGYENDRIHGRSANR